MIVEVTVTEKDIAMGTQRNCADCPGARAIRRALQWTTRVLVTDKVSLLKFESNGNGVLRHTVALPTKLAAFIAGFDRGLLVKPITFSIEVPDEFMK